MKTIKHFLTLIAIAFSLNACTQSSHNELNGLYSRGEESIYFNDGNCYFFSNPSDKTFEWDEHYSYKYANREIQFKYTGDFQQAYENNKVAKVWWRLTDERLRENAAFVRIESLQDWLEKQHKNWASHFADKIYGFVKQKKSDLSKAQFEECLNYKGFINHMDVKSYKMFKEVEIPDIILSIYGELKKNNKLKSASEAPKPIEKKKTLSTEFNVKWSDWACIDIEDKDKSKGTFTFFIYMFPGKELTAKEKLFRPKRKPNISIFYAAELLKDGKVIGRFTNAINPKEMKAREFSLTQSMWHKIGGTFNNGGKTYANSTLEYFDTKWNDLSDGNYKIKVYVNETDGATRTKVFPFKISNGEITGDTSITTKSFKKKHKITRFDSEYIFLSFKS